MNEFMKLLLSLSISGILLFLFIRCLKMLYQNKFSKRWQYYIWLAAVLRFLTPFTPDHTITGSLFEHFLDSTTNAAITRENPTSLNAAVTGTTAYGETEPAQTGKNAGAESAFLSPDPYIWLFFVWAALALVFLIRKITIYQSYTQYIQAGNTEVSDIHTLNLLSDCAEKLNIRTKIELYQNAFIASPLMIGFFRPGIILPAGEWEDKKLHYAFTHELVHYKQKDMFYKWLIQIVICLHWFNPLVYLLEKEINRACELSCDESVITALDDQERREYGDMLIAFLKSDSHYKNSPASITLTAGAAQIKERLGAIMNFNKKSKTVKAAASLTAAAVCAVFTVTGAYAAPLPSTESAHASKDIPAEMTQTTENRNNDRLSQISYRQNSYYIHSYIIEIGWNFNIKKQSFSSQKELVLTDQSEMTVYFTDTAAEYENNSEALAAVSELIDLLRKDDIFPKMEAPFIVDITYVGDTGIEVLAENYFEKEDYTHFSALFPALDKEVQKEYFEKIYQADQINFFSLVVEHMDGESLSEYAARAEQDENDDYFCLLADFMPPDMRESYAEKYYKNNDIGSFLFLLSGMTKEEKLNWLTRAENDEKEDFYWITADELSDHAYYY